MVSVRSRSRDSRVAIAHEWLVRYAGSERCVAEMLEAFPGAELLTTVLEASALPACVSARPGRRFSSMFRGLRSTTNGSCR